MIKNVHFFVLVILFVGGCGSKDASISKIVAGKNHAYEVIDYNGEIGGLGNAKDPIKPEKPSLPSSGLTDPDASQNKLEVMWPENIDAYSIAAQDVSKINRVELPFSAHPCCNDFGSASKRPGIDNAFVKLNMLAVTPYFHGGMPEPRSITQVNAKLRAYMDAAPAYLINQHHFIPANSRSHSPIEARSLLFVVRGESSVSPRGGLFFKQCDTVYWEFLHSSFVSKKNETSGNVWVPRSYANPAMYYTNLSQIRFMIDEVILPLPVGPIVLELPVKHAVFQAEVKRNGTPDGEEQIKVKTRFRNGSMSGYVMIDDLFVGLNEYLQKNCSCGASEPLFVKDRSGYWRGQCSLESYLSCSSSQVNEVCRSFIRQYESEDSPFFCENFPNTIHNRVADIESTGVGGKEGNAVGEAKVWDALSVGYRWEASPLCGSYIAK